MVIHNDGRYTAGEERSPVPVLPGTIIYSALPLLRPEGCPPLLPLEGFPLALRQQQIGAVRNWFTAMRGVKHEHVDGICAEYSWRKYGEPRNPRMNPRNDMMVDIVANPLV